MKVRRKVFILLLGVPCASLASPLPLPDLLLGLNSIKIRILHLVMLVAPNLMVCLYGWQHLKIAIITEHLATTIIQYHAVIATVVDLFLFVNQLIQ